MRFIAIVAVVFTSACGSPDDPCADSTCRGTPGEACTGASCAGTPPAPAPYDEPAQPSATPTPQPSPVCGDGTCNGGETHGSCASDCACASGKIACDGACIASTSDCCNSGDAHFCASGECRLTGGSYACFAPEPPAQFSGFSTLNLFVGAYWEYEFDRTTWKNGDVYEHAASQMRFELTDSRTVEVPEWGATITLYRRERSLVSGDATELGASSWTWIGTFNERLVGATAQSDGSLRLYKVYDGYTGAVRYGGLLGHATNSESWPMRWVEGATRYFSGTFIEAGVGGSSGGCTDAAGVHVCTPHEGAEEKEYLDPTLGFLGLEIHRTNTYPDGVWTGATYLGLTATNVAPF